MSAWSTPPSWRDFQPIQRPDSAYFFLPLDVLGVDRSKAPTLTFFPSTTLVYPFTLTNFLPLLVSAIVEFPRLYITDINTSFSSVQEPFLRASLFVRPSAYFLRPTSSPNAPPTLSGVRLASVASACHACESSDPARPTATEKANCVDGHCREKCP